MQTELRILMATRFEAFAVVEAEARSRAKKTWVGPEGSGEMPPARLLVMTRERKGYGLYGFTGAGEFSGDTWHRRKDEALKQARWEYGDKIGPWRSMDNKSGDFHQVVRELVEALVAAGEI